MSTNIPSARTTIKSAVSASSRPTATTLSQETSSDYVDYNLADVAR